MTYLTTQIELGCPNFVASLAKLCADHASLTERGEEETLLDGVYRRLNDFECLSNDGRIVYRGGHHVAVCQGQRRLVLITAR